MNSGLSLVRAAGTCASLTGQLLRADPEFSRVLIAFDAPRAAARSRFLDHNDACRVAQAVVPRRRFLRRPVLPVPAPAAPEDVTAAISRAVRKSDLPALTAAPLAHLDAASTEDGLTAIHIAVVARQWESVAHLLGRGVNVNAITTAGCVPRVLFALSSE